MNIDGGGRSSKALIAAAAGAAILLAGGSVAYRAMRAGAGTAGAPAAPRAAPTAQVNPESGWIAEKAREAGGDINRLSPADRARLDRLTSGHGEQALEAFAPRGAAAAPAPASP